MCHAYTNDVAILGSNEQGIKYTTKQLIYSEYKKWGL